VRGLLRNVPNQGWLNAFAFRRVACEVYEFFIAFSVSEDIHVQISEPGVDAADFNRRRLIAPRPIVSSDEMLEPFDPPLARAVCYQRYRPA
jgi:hypothetical protein